MLSFLDSYHELQAQELCEVGGEHVQETILTFTKCLKLHFQQQAMLFEKESLSESRWAAVFHAPKAFVEMGLQKTATNDEKT